MQNLKVVIEEVQLLGELPYSPIEKIEYLGKYSSFNRKNYFVKHDYFKDAPIKYNSYTLYTNKNSYDYPTISILEYNGDIFDTYIYNYTYTNLDFPEDFLKIWYNGEIYEVEGTDTLTNNFNEGNAHNYKIYGGGLSITGSLIIEQGSPPLTFTTDGNKTLTNYRIYGNTATMYSAAHGHDINTGSVGTNVNPNLFDLAAFKAKVTTILNGTVTWLTDGMTITASNANEAITYPFSGQSVYTVSVEPNTAYNLSFDCTGDTDYINVVVFKNHVGAGGIWFRAYYNRFVTGNDTSTLSFRFGTFGGVGKSVTYQNIKLQKADNYNLPVSIGEHDYSINLSSQLGITNGVADYIDFAAQKRYNADGTEESISIPEVVTTTGSNTLSIDTKVAPSNVYIAYSDDFVINATGEKGEYKIWSTGISPMIFYPEETPLIDYKLYGKTEKINNVDTGVGDLVTDSSSQYYEKYKIPIIITLSNLLTDLIPEENSMPSDITNDETGLSVYRQNTPHPEYGIAYRLNTISGVTYTVTWTYCSSLSYVEFNNRLSGTQLPVGGAFSLTRSNTAGEYSLTFTAQGQTSLFLHAYTYSVIFDLRNLKVSVSSETDIYLDEPLFNGDSTSLSETEVNIPVIANSYNTLSVNTTVKPSKIEIAPIKRQKYDIPLTLNNNSISGRILLNSPLKKVGNIADYISYIQKDGYNVFYYIRTLILDGTENWAVDSEKFYINTPFINYVPNSPVYCNTINSQILDLNEDSEDIWISDEGKLCIIKTDISLTVESIKNFLSNNLSVIGYQLSIPSTDLISMPALPMEGNIDGTKKENSLSVDTTIAPSKIVIQNIKTYYTTQELEEQIYNN